MERSIHYWVICRPVFDRAPAFQAAKPKMTLEDAVIESDVLQAPLESMSPSMTEMLYEVEFS